MNNERNHTPEPGQTPASTPGQTPAPAPGQMTAPGQTPVENWARSDMPPAGPSKGSDPESKRRILYLALAGLGINGIVVPAIMALLIDPSALPAFVLFELIFQLLIWLILYAIGQRMLRRRGFKTAMIFMVVAIFVAGLPFIGCMGLLGG